MIFVSQLTNSHTDTEFLHWPHYKINVYTCESSCEFLMLDIFTVLLTLDIKDKRIFMGSHISVEFVIFACHIWLILISLVYLFQFNRKKNVTESFQSNCSQYNLYYTNYLLKSMPWSWYYLQSSLVDIKWREGLLYCQTSTLANCKSNRWIKYAYRHTSLCKYKYIYLYIYIYIYIHTHIYIYIYIYIYIFVWDRISKDFRFGCVCYNNNCLEYIA